MNTQGKEVGRIDIDKLQDAEELDSAAAADVRRHDDANEWRSLQGSMGL